MCGGRRNTLASKRCPLFSCTHTVSRQPPGIPGNRKRIKVLKSSPTTFLPSRFESIIFLHFPSRTFHHLSPCSLLPFLPLLSRLTVSLSPVTLLPTPHLRPTLTRSLPGQDPIPPSPPSAVWPTPISPTSPPTPSLPRRRLESHVLLPVLKKVEARSPTSGPTLKSATVPAPTLTPLLARSSMPTMTWVTAETRTMHPSTTLSLHTPSKSATTPSTPTRPRLSTLLPPSRV